MFAIFSHGGKQYQVKKGQIVRIEKVDLKVGSNFNIQNILMIANTKDTQIGTPNLPNSNIISNIIKHGRKKKIKIIKFKRRKHYKKQQGHRQHFTDIKIIDIITKKPLSS